MTTNATIEQLNEALAKVNASYDNNISFETIAPKTKNVRTFTLKAKSKLKGARKSFSGRNLPKASWHVHGHLFDALFAIDKNIWVKSLGKKITAEGGNWEDQNIGSQMRPLMFSETSIENDEDYKVIINFMSGVAEVYMYTGFAPIHSEKTVDKAEAWCNRKGYVIDSIID